MDRRSLMTAAAPLNIRDRDRTGYSFKNVVAHGI